MSDDEMTDDSNELQVPRGWVRHPPERMLITPLMAGLGGMVAFLRRRRDRRLAADPHLRSASVGRLGAALQPGGFGPQPVRAERLLRVSLRILAAPGRALPELLPLSQGLAAG